MTQPIDTKVIDAKKAVDVSRCLLCPSASTLLMHDLIFVNALDRQAFKSQHNETFRD